jgi:two-component system copper resistance phosphate regulon response regulator CusR
MRILVVEDNIKTADYICAGLKENFYIPEAAYDGQDGLFLATNKQYDLIILDIMMPKMDGLELIKQLRIRDNMTPVIFLTARSHVDDRVSGFEQGGDDYLVKPFSFAELLVRIRSLLRRSQPRSSDILQIADLRLDVLKHKASRGDKNINLTPKEFTLLMLLARRTGEVLSRTYIAQEVWDIHFDSDTNAIDVAIKRLRDKMDNETQTKLIHTVRGVGYVLEER